MEEKKGLRPPYATSGQVDQILDIFKRIAPRKIDAKFVIENKITTAPNAFKVLDFAKWLGIVDNSGNVREEISSKLRLVGEEREKFIAELVKKSYKDIFDSVNLEQARKDDIINYFVSHYKFGGSQALYAARLFMHLCQRTGVKVSEDLKKKTHTGTSSPKKYKIKSVKPDNKKITQNDERPLYNVPEEGTIVLSIVGNGLNRKVIARNKEELQELYEGKFKSLVEAAKLLFLEEEQKTDNHINESDEELEPD
ncbi:DUF5343 domain-containing protein [Candidatus Woesearchaeota archaeon]|nr:DUF5343 domain-containing protein [Candidatus Woesearchaeota archaeon]